LNLEREVQLLKDKIYSLENEKEQMIKKLSEENLVLLGKISILEDTLVERDRLLVEIEKKLISGMQEPNGIAYEIKTCSNCMDLLHVEDSLIFEKLWTELSNSLPQTGKLASNKILLDLLSLLLQLDFLWNLYNNLFMSKERN
jgi:hypothetical protein